MTINKDFRTKNNDELIEIVNKLRIKLLEYRFKSTTGEFDKPNKIRFAKKSLAQALTILRERNVSFQHKQLQKIEYLKKQESIFSAKENVEKNNNDNIKESDDK